ncbi:UBC-like protein [Syncephalis fuscata]|nr:UBC-like protein [Syncephalis fuscata]
MATVAATRRLTKEYKLIRTSPPDYLIAKPLEHDILEWHYVLTGPPDTPYLGGEYHGKLVFPPEYPYRPPSIYMITPNGRFQTNVRLCLSMSDFHPGHWNPSWSVATILNGLLSFMVGDESTTGSVHTSEADKRWLSTRSHAYNRSNSEFNEVFPELCLPETTPVDVTRHTTESRPVEDDTTLTAASTPGSAAVTNNNYTNTNGAPIVQSLIDIKVSQ